MRISDWSSDVCSSDLSEEGPALCLSGGRALLRPDARLRHQRTEDRVPDRLPHLSAVSRDRPCRRGGADVAGPDDAVAAADLAAVQAAAVRAGRWLAADQGLARRQLLQASKARTCDADYF